MKKTYKDLGYDSYKHYLSSPHWQSFRAKVLSRPGNRKCHVCGGFPVELHHLTYKWIGSEDERSVAVVCHACHGELHELEREHRLDYVWRDIQTKLRDPAVLSTLNGQRPSPQRLYWIGREEERLARENRMKETAEEIIARLEEERERNYSQRRAAHSLRPAPSKEQSTGGWNWGLFLGFYLFLGVMYLLYLAAY